LISAPFCVPGISIFTTTCLPSKKGESASGFCAIALTEVNITAQHTAKPKPSNSNAQRERRIVLPPASSHLSKLLGSILTGPGCQVNIEHRPARTNQLFFLLLQKGNQVPASLPLGNAQLHLFIL